MEKNVLSLEDFEGKTVSLIYEGSNLPKGEIGPKEITGKLSRVGKYTCRFETNHHENIKLITKEIQLSSVKTSDFIESENYIETE